MADKPIIKPEVRRRLDELQAMVDEGLMIKPQQIIAALTDIAITGKSEKTILSALDKLSKINGMYKETVLNEHTGSVTIEDKRAAMNEWIDGLNKKED